MHPSTNKQNKLALVPAKQKTKTVREAGFPFFPIFFVLLPFCLDLNPNNGQAAWIWIWGQGSG